MVQTAHRFFSNRRPLDLPPGKSSGRPYIEYPNVGHMVGAVVSARLATFAELSSVLSTEDLFDLYEILVVDSYNRSVE